MQPGEQQPVHLLGLLDKLTQAGWIVSYAFRDTDGPNKQAVIQFTPEGKAKLMAMLGLLNDIEMRASPMTEGELAHLKTVAQAASFTPPQNPPSR